MHFETQRLDEYGCKETLEICIDSIVVNVLIMESAIFYNQIKLTDANKTFIKSVERYVKKQPGMIVYIVSSPLGSRISYQNEESVAVMLSPGYKMMFINLEHNDCFEDYVDDFINDVGVISANYNYQEYIGRTRSWKKVHTAQFDIGNVDLENIDLFFEQNKLSEEYYRVSELLISLVTGSINDIEKIGVDQPRSVLEKVRRKIVLFDAQQTRFIYTDYAVKKVISVQGLSGTGKTELLLHKLKDLYSDRNNYKVFFTCHNIALSRKLQERIPHFFDFMRVNKQIKWNQQLWVRHAWGSRFEPNSGFYAYICNYYGLSFYQFDKQHNYDFIFNNALEEIKRIPPKEFEPCFDYILVDESQDFPDVFFELCKKVVKYKIYVAGDVFQDIFESLDRKPRGVDIVLNRCYRTDPSTLMFAHGVGLGLFESEKLNWFDKKEWERLGYKSEIKDNLLRLSRLPIKRFDDIHTGDSVEIRYDTQTSTVCSIISSLFADIDGLNAGDIAIIIVDDDNSIYSYIDLLCLNISQKLGLWTTRGYESKQAETDKIYVTNPNNVKGLEFPYVICITRSIQNTYKYRNTLYTMLTRSFIKSYLLISDTKSKSFIEGGWQQIKEHACIETIIPTDDELAAIKNRTLRYRMNEMDDRDLLIGQVFDSLKIDDGDRKQKIKKMLETAGVDTSDADSIKDFVESVSRFIV